VLDNRDISESAFVLRLERRGLAFRPGQWINLGRPGSLQRREYTIYSPPSEDYLEVLVKEVNGGTVSRELHRCRSGDMLEAEGPHGSFCIAPDAVRARFLFIGSGTGVSPFHCLTLSYPGLDYVLLHGARAPRQLYDHEVFDPKRFIACISGPERPAEGTCFHAGRVTSYLRENPIDSSCFCYLCGNSDMIYECYAILRGHGVPPSRIFAEVYF
jgi:ferredoxin--NADP+ reductase/benzoate/toluate 1,2-dioxygenase reductase subunit